MAEETFKSIVKQPCSLPSNPSSVHLPHQGTWQLLSQVDNSVPWKAEVMQTQDDKTPLNAVGPILCCQVFYKI